MKSGKHREALAHLREAERIAREMKGHNKRICAKVTLPLSEARASGWVAENSRGRKKGGNPVKTSCQSASSSLEAKKFPPNFPLDGKLFDVFASLLQLAELHGGGVLKSIANDFNVALLRYQNDRTCDPARDFFINLKQQCQRVLQLRIISDEVRGIFQQHLEYIEEQIRNGHVERQKQTILTYDEDIFDSYD